MLFFRKKIFEYLIVIAICFMAVDAYGGGVEIGFVDVPALNVRSCASRSCEILQVLDAGARVRILKEKGEWLQVSCEGKVGYVSSNSEFLKRYVDHTAVPAEDIDPEDAREKAREIARRIRENREEISSFEKQEKSLADELDILDRQLSRARNRLEAIRGEAEEVNLRLEKIVPELEKTRAVIDEKQGYARKRLTALYKLNRLGEMNLLATAGSLSDVFRRKAAIEAVVEQDEQVIGGLMSEKRKLSGLQSELEKQKAEKAGLKKDLKQTLSDLNQAAEARKQLMAQLKTRKSNRMAALDYLKNAASLMDKTLSELKPQTPQTPETPTQFSRYQGLLKMPVEGKVISKYGKFVEPQSGAVNFRNGIEIQSDSGAPVRAVSTGRAIFTDWLKGFGRVIILDHGDSYYTVYAHVDDLFCRKGDAVEAGEVIATVGDTGSLVGPALYFEVRHHGDPLDPLVWIENG